jgi:hypothetical protein
MLILINSVHSRKAGNAWNDPVPDAVLVTAALSATFEREWLFS